MFEINDPETKKNIDKLHELGQEHVLDFWDTLSKSQRNNLLEQINTIDFNLLVKFIDTVKNLGESEPQYSNLEPADLISLEERKTRDPEAVGCGEEQLSNGKVAAFLVAGGQGTRLGFDGPKGMYPVTPVKKKSLFQLHAEKLLAMSKKYGKQIPWYILTSETNNDQTIEFFNKNDFFGYDIADVIFFIQDMIPGLDRQGRLILDAPDHIFKNPNGHGGSLKALWEKGAVTDMKNRGIEHIFYFQVDNVLTRICDPAYIGYHVLGESEMSNKVVHKSSPEEKTGILCLIDGKLGLVEYSDLDKENMYALNEDGTLKFWGGSIAIHIFDIDFVELENKNGFKLPYHLAEKSIPYINKKGKLVKPEDKNGIKFETFVFDALLDTKKSVSIEVDRNKEFSPLKNSSGDNSPITINRDLINMYSSWIENAGYKIKSDLDGNVAANVEISPLFAVNERELKKKKIDIDPNADEIYLG